jgi:hypothetical protein
MIFFDSREPNKYNFLKKIIYPYLSDFTKKRYGGFKDGSYVFLQELFDKSNIVYSYGIGSDPQGLRFDLDCADQNKNVYMYDGSINNPPVNHPNFIFKSEFLFKSLIKNHIKENNHENEKNMILKMDIEGYEYEVINNDIDFISKHFDQISIEIHGLIEEIPEKWTIEEPISSIKKDKHIKQEFFKKICQYYNIIHIHANNHSPRYIDFPDSLEISFLRKDYPLFKLDKNEYPIDKLDFPNYDGREDYILNWWV